MSNELDELRKEIVELRAEIALAERTVFGANKHAEMAVIALKREMIEFVGVRFDGISKRLDGISEISAGRSAWVRDFDERLKAIESQIRAIKRTKLEPKAKVAAAGAAPGWAKVANSR